MKDRVSEWRIDRLMSVAREFPYCVATILTYAAMLTGVSLLVVKLRLYDSLLYFFLIPCVLSALFFKRRVYLSMQVLLVGAAVWVTSRVSSSFETSLINIAAVGVSLLLITEIIHALATVRKRAEQALRESKQRLELALRGGDLGTWDWNIQTDEVQFNERWAEMKGYTLDEIEPHLSTWENLVHPEDLPAVYEKLNAHLEGKTPFYEAEFRMRHKSGEWMWVLDRGKVIERDAEGQPLRACGTHLDITDRKRAEKELDRRRQLWDALMENTPDLVYFKDDNHRIIRASQAYADIFDVNAEYLVGKTTAELWSSEAEEILADERRVLAGKPIIRKEREVTTPTGESRWYLLTKIPIYEEENVVGFFAIDKDITARKEMQQHLRQQERLAAVGQLAAGLAHDFRNRLNPIILYAEMDLKSHDLPPGLVQNLETILNEAQGMADLVQKMLDLSSRATLRPQPVGLTALANDVVETLRPQLPDDVQVAVDKGPGEYVALGDEGRVRQALTNLALNARDAMPGGGELRFALSRVAIASGERPPVADMPPGDWVCLVVSDTGTGMTEDVQEHLFEPFFTTKDVDKGTGLGLAQVYGIVRQHEGYIDVETEPGAGTTFRIYLPAYEERTEEAEIQEPDSDPLGRDETILLVEDDEDLRKAARETLESLGYRVVTAANGSEALARCQTPRWSGERSQQIDLVVADLTMPKMDGEELMRELERTRPTLGW